MLWNKSRLRLIFERSLLKQGNAAPFSPNNVVNSLSMNDIHGHKI